MQLTILRRDTTTKFRILTNGVSAESIFQSQVAQTFVLECQKCAKMYVMMYICRICFRPHYNASYGRFSKSIRPDECGK